MKGYSQSSLILPQPKPTLETPSAWRSQIPTGTSPQAPGCDKPRATLGVSHHPEQDDKTQPQIWLREREAPSTVQTHCAPSQSSTSKVIAINVIKVKQATFKMYANSTLLVMPKSSFTFFIKITQIFFAALGIKLINKYIN